MATATRNLVTTGLPGKVGNLVFRIRESKTTAYVMSPRKASLSKKQTEAQLEFKPAVAQARKALSIDAEREHFKELAKKEKRVRIALRYPIFLN